MDGWRWRLSPTTPVGIVFFRQSPFYSLTWKQPVVGWWPPLMIVANSRHTQVGAHPSSPSLLLRASPSTTTSSSLLRTEVSPAFIQLWKSGGWKVVNARMEEPGGGRRRRILNKSFYLLTTILCPCTPWIGSKLTVPVFGRGGERGFVVESKSFVIKNRQHC